MEYTIIKYTDNYEEEWDRFVLEQSMNGTFLHSRRFLNYHPTGRFIDSSYVVYDEKNHLVAVCSACEKMENGEKVLFSHGGSTYGGIIICDRVYKTSKLVALVSQLKERWKQDDFQRVILKQTPDLFCKRSVDLLEYVLYYAGFQEWKELNLYVDLKEYTEENVLSHFSQGKRTNVHNCQKAGLECRKISTHEEIELFVELLSMTLEKYGKKPVHIADELFEFQQKRLHEECELFGIFNVNGDMLAGAMMFYFKNGVAHTQYLCADSAYNTLSPMTFAYYSMIIEMMRKGYDKLSWGITTEDNGYYLNKGLTNSKESFGSRYTINRTYKIRIE